MTATFQINADIPEATGLIEYLRTLPFVTEKKTNEDNFRPMTIEEYNARIDRAMEDYHAGRFISHEEMGKRIASWR